MQKFCYWSVYVLVENIYLVLKCPKSVKDEITRSCLLYRGVCYYMLSHVVRGNFLLTQLLDINSNLTRCA